MFRSLILAAVLLASARWSPMRAKSPCCHRLNYKLAIVMTTADTGTVATGATVTTGIAIMNGVKTAGGNTITAITVAGISVRLTNAATAKAGKIVTTAVAAGVTEKAEATVTAITINNKRSLPAPFSFTGLCLSATTSLTPPPRPQWPTRRVSPTSNSPDRPSVICCW